MKQICSITLTTLLFIIGGVTCIAQLRVDSIGHVGIGTTSTESQLSVGGSNASYYTYIDPISKKSTMYMKNYSTGLTICNDYSGNKTVTGIYVMPIAGKSNQGSYGIKCMSGITTGLNYAVYATLPPVTTGSVFQAAIFGTVGNSTGGPLSPGDWAGYFCGNTAVTGSLTASSILIPSVNSNQTGESTSSTVRRFSDGNAVCKKLQKIELLEFDGPNKTEDLVEDDGATDELYQNMLNAYSDAVTKTDNVNSNKANNITHYGLAADELRNIYPNLVHEGLDGNVSINYIEMVPLLIQAIKELTAKVAELEGRLSVK